MTGYGLGGQGMGLDSWKGKEGFLFTASGLFLRPANPCIQWALGQNMELPTTHSLLYLHFFIHFHGTVLN
jgi:hypothetical protein